MQKIIRYIRDKKRNPIGAVVALENGRTGWSMCHPGDRFDKGLAVEIATGRALKGRTAAQTPDAVRKVLPRVRESAARAFQAF